MHSIDLKHIVTAVVAAVISSGVLAAERGPRILREPVLGLRYEAAHVKFDSMPAHALANCETMQDSENSKGVWYIFAQAANASGRTYYVSGGYAIRKISPKHLKYETGDLGAVFFTDRGACTYIDTAREVFDARLLDDELPESVLKLLAADYAKRLERAFGSAARLRTEIRNQHIDREALPPELLQTLTPYFGK